MSDIIKHYMQKEGEALMDLEVDFPGLKYSECSGLLDKGKRTDVYIEKHANSDVVRAWQGNDVCREATTITFTFFFIDTSTSKRQDTYDAFYRYIQNGKIHYWDTKRKKEALLILTDALKPKEDEYKGSIPYICADFKFQNLWGECKDKTL